jgi:hypothetical protein
LSLRWSLPHVHRASAAGFRMARLLARRARLRGRAVQFLWAGAIGAIAPHFDLAYFIRR